MRSQTLSGVDLRLEGSAHADGGAIDTSMDYEVEPARIIELAGADITLFKEALDEIGSITEEAIPLECCDEVIRFLVAQLEEIAHAQMCTSEPILDAELEYVVEMGLAVMRATVVGGIPSNPELVAGMDFCLHAMARLTGSLCYVCETVHETLLESCIWFCKLTCTVPDFVNELVVEEMLTVEMSGSRRRRLTLILFLLEIWDCNICQLVTADHQIREAYLELVESIHLETEYEIIFYFY